MHVLLQQLWRIWLLQSIHQAQAGDEEGFEMEDAEEGDLEDESIYKEGGEIDDFADTDYLDDELDYVKDYYEDY